MWIVTCKTCNFLIFKFYPKLNSSLNFRNCHLHPFSMVHLPTIFMTLCAYIYKGHEFSMRRMALYADRLIFWPRDLKIRVMRKMVRLSNINPLFFVTF